MRYKIYFEAGSNGSKGVKSTSFSISSWLLVLVNTKILAYYIATPDLD